MLLDFVKLARPKHYLKNGLVFLPLLFSGKLFDDHNFGHVVVAAIVFSLVASVTYVINDVQDADKDRYHPSKKFRPVAAGVISVTQAWIFAAILAAAAAILGYLIHIDAIVWALLATYLVINLAYSGGLKDIPVLDVAVLAAGFVLRVLYGGNIVNIGISRWLYLTVLAGAFYMGLGKRRGELLISGARSRKVNELYTVNFLDKNMNVCLALTLVFYSLWATDPASNAYHLYWTIPVVMILMLTYSLDVEKNGSMGDPVDVLLGNKMLGIFVLLYIVLIACLLYI